MLLTKESDRSREDTVDALLFGCNPAVLCTACIPRCSVLRTHSLSGGGDHPRVIPHSPVPYILPVHFLQCFHKIIWIFERNKAVTSALVRPFVPYHLGFLQRWVLRESTCQSFVRHFVSHVPDKDAKVVCVDDTRGFGWCTC